MLVVCTWIRLVLNREYNHHLHVFPLNIERPSLNTWDLAKAIIGGVLLFLLLTMAGMYLRLWVWALLVRLEIISRSTESFFFSGRAFAIVLVFVATLSLGLSCVYVRRRLHALRFDGAWRRQPMSPMSAYYALALSFVPFIGLAVAYGFC